MGTIIRLLTWLGWYEPKENPNPIKWEEIYCHCHHKFGQHTMVELYEYDCTVCSCKNGYPLLGG